MKKWTIKTPTAELLIVELQTKVINSSYHIHKTPKGILIKDDTVEKFISNKYTLLGKPDEIREEDARELVELPIDKWGDDKFRFLDYHHDGHYNLFTAKESLLSLIESELFWDVNPIPTPEIQWGFDELGNFHGEYDDNWVSAFKEAEQKTFDKNISLIFKKNKQ